MLELPLALTALFSVGLFLHEFYQNKKLTENPHILQDSQEKANFLLHNAMKKAEAILVESELDQIKNLARTTLVGDKLHTEIQDAISRNSQDVKQVLDLQLKSVAPYVDHAEKEYVNYLEHLKKDAEGAQLQLQEFVKTKTAEVFERFEQNLASFLTQTEQSSISYIEKELSSSRALIDMYKQQQLKIIDENIVAMLERTLSIVLTKKLNLQDQVDLVYEALEKAKAEKLII